MGTNKKLDDLTDEALLEAVRAGDGAALEALLERYAPAVQRFGVKMCRDAEDAKDVLQDTMLAAARGLRQFRGASSVSTWLYTIARSACIKKRRKHAGENVALDDEEVMGVPAPGSTPDEAARERQIGDALEAAIEALAPQYREVLLLRDVEGLSAAEVADVVGVGVPAVKSRLHRARLAVRERLLPFMESRLPGRPDCPDIVPMLSQYLEGEIGPSDCAKMERHVDGCERCQRECDSLRRVLALCKSSARGESIPPDVAAAVRRAVAQLASL